MFTMEFTHKLFTGGPKEQIPAMNRVKAIIKGGNFSGIAFPFSKEYASWETDEVKPQNMYTDRCTGIWAKRIFTFQQFSADGAAAKTFFNLQ